MGRLVTTVSILFAISTPAYADGVFDVCKGESKAVVPGTGQMSIAVIYPDDFPGRTTREVLYRLVDHVFDHHGDRADPRHDPSTDLFGLAQSIADRTHGMVSIEDAQSHVLEYADVGLMSMYIADCDALAKIADELGKAAESKDLKDRAARYRAKLATMWDEQAGIFLNKDLHTGKSNTRLSPTNFYPMLAKAATPEQARTMIDKHLLNNNEFWGEWVIPSIARNDPAFKDQNYWRGRIWGPMNYLVYLGLLNYQDSTARKDFAERSYALFLKEWKENGHVHENYNAILGTGDDVTNSDRFYHWGALLGYVEYLEQGIGNRE